MKAIIFDLGHTLIDYYNDWREPEKKAVSDTYRLFARRVDADVDKKEFEESLYSFLKNARRKRAEEMVEVPLRSILKECFRKFGYEDEGTLVEEGLEIFYNALLEHRKLIEGVPEMLSFLKEKGYLIGLISDVAWGLPSTFPRKDIRHYRIDSYFDDMVFSTDVGLRKPHPRIFRISLENLGVESDEAVYIGNSLQADIKGALNAGMKGILKKSRYFFPDDTIVPSAVIERWSELRRILEDLE